jgi:hypothetical protein
VIALVANAPKQHRAQALTEKLLRMIKEDLPELVRAPIEIPIDVPIVETVKEAVKLQVTLKNLKARLLSESTKSSYRCFWRTGSPVKVEAIHEEVVARQGRRVHCATTHRSASRREVRHDTRALPKEATEHMQVDVPPVSEQKEASNELTPAVQGSVQDPPLEIVMTEQELLTFSGFYPSTFTDLPSDIYPMSNVPGDQTLLCSRITNLQSLHSTKSSKRDPPKPDLPKSRITRKQPGHCIARPGQRSIQPPPPSHSLSFKTKTPFS